MELSLRAIFRDFNASKFVVYLSVLIFSLLLALRLDRTIHVNYAIVFLPLWMYKIVVIAGAIVGCASHCHNPPSSVDITIEIDYRSMVLSTGEHLLLLIFELLACYKLEVESHPDLEQPMWMLVFVPLILQSIVAILICIWSFRQDKSFEFELFFAVNLVQFVFLALKFDHLVDWNWAIVFVPLWILICLSLIGVLYAIILAVLLIRSIDLLPEHRRQHVYSAVGYTFLVVPILIFLVLITGKLDSIEMGRQDDAARMPYTIVCAPLYISLLCLLLMAIGTKGGNPWWFGMRRDFCVFLLDTCPCLREYGNVSYKFGASHNTASGDRRMQQRESAVLMQIRTGDDLGQQQSTNLDAVISSSIVTRPSSYMRPILPTITIESPV